MYREKHVGYIYKWGSNRSLYEDGPNFLFRKDRGSKRLQLKANIFVLAVNPRTLKQGEQARIFLFIWNFIGKYFCHLFSNIVCLGTAPFWASTIFGDEHQLHASAALSRENGFNIPLTGKLNSLWRLHWLGGEEQNFYPCRKSNRSQPLISMPAPLIRLQYAFTTGTVLFTSLMLCHCRSTYAHVRTPRVES
jgi:hypothetical protein